MTIPTKRQRRSIWIPTSLLPDISGDVSFQEHLLEQRANQAIRLWGYRVRATVEAGLTNLNFPGQSWSKTVALYAAPLGGGAGPSMLDIGAGIIDGWEDGFIIGGETVASEFTVKSLFLDSAYIQTDLMLPAIYLGGALRTTHLTTLDWNIHVLLEFEWVDVTLGEMIALNLLWGRDPFDLRDDNALHRQVSIEAQLK